LHTDATQSAGKIRVNVDELGVDLLSLSAHKMYGPKGVGALFIRGGMRVEPLIHGIGHEGGLRGGMENVPGIMGMGRAASLAAKMLDEIQPRMTELSERLLNQLRDGIGDELRVQGDLAPRLPNTLSVNFPGVNAAKLLQLAPEVAAWTAASPYDDLSGASPTLDAMKVRPEHSVGTVRLSVGWYTAEDEIDFAASRLLDAWERLK
jgi:cysteine desulfurase